jgi:protein TonB
VVPVREEDAPEEVILPSTDRTYGVGEGEGEPDTPGALDGRALDNPPPPDEPLPNRGDPIDADELPVLVRDLKPVYPDLAREAGVEGRVIVHMLIGKDGRVMDAVIDPNNSIVMLDSSVLDAVRKLVFTPAFRNNRPVPVWVSRVYRFRLHGGTVE